MFMCVLCLMFVYVCFMSDVCVCVFCLMFVYVCFMSDVCVCVFYVCKVIGFVD